MTLNEFKAWFEGYTEGLEGAPTAAQFARIKEKVKEITGEPVTERIFIDKYWPQVFRPWSPPYYQWVNTASSGYATGGGSVGAGFNSTAAMYALGQSESAVN